MKKIQRRYRYQGINRAGLRLEAEILALNAAKAKELLRQQGIVAEKIHLVLPGIFARKHKPEDVRLFSRQLASLIEAGLPLLQALEILAQSQVKLQTLIQQIACDIAAGNSLADALAKEGSYFNALFCNLVRAGEQSGTLDLMLLKAAAHQEKIHQIRKKITKALSYPLIIITAASLLTTGLLIFIIPQFQNLFQGLGAELPMVTVVLLQVAGFIQKRGLYLLLLAIPCVYGFLHIQKRTPALAELLEKTLLQFPLFGPLIRKHRIADLSRNLSIVFAAGLPLSEALPLAASATSSRLYSKGLSIVGSQILTGLSLHTAMKNTNLFPPMVLGLIVVGEASGTLEPMLNRIAGLYEEEVDRAVELLDNLLEPFIMMILGVLVGGLVIALYLPIFQLGSAL